MGWNEGLQIFESYQPLSEYLLLQVETLMTPDRGLLFSDLLQVFLPSIGTDFKLLRFVTIFFYLGSILFFFFVIAKPSLGGFWALCATILWSTHLELFDKSVIVTPYSLNFFITLFFLHSHLKFDGTRKSIIYHSLTSFLAIASLYTSLLPVLISFFLLFPRLKNVPLISFLFYLPTIIYSLLKSLLILRFRFIDRLGNSEFSRNSFVENTFDFLQLFNVKWPGFLFKNMGIHFVTYTLASVFILVSIFVFFLFLKKERDRFSRYIFVYLVLSVVSYFAMNFIGAQEIVTRYYFNLLPPLYFSYCYFLRHLAMRGKALLAMVLLTSSLFVSATNIAIDLNSHLELPMVSIAEYLHPHLSLEDSVCFPQSQYRGEEFWQLSMTGDFRQRFQQENIKAISSCRDLPSKKAIYFVTWYTDLKEIPPCQNEDQAYDCLTKEMQRELKIRTESDFYYIKAHQKNVDVYIRRFDKDQ